MDDNNSSPDPFLSKDSTLSFLPKKRNLLDVLQDDGTSNLFGIEEDPSAASFSATAPSFFFPPPHVSSSSSSSSSLNTLNTHPLFQLIPKKKIKPKTEFHSLSKYEDEIEDIDEEMEHQQDSFIVKHPLLNHATSLMDHESIFFPSSSPSVQFQITSPPFSPKQEKNGNEEAEEEEEEEEGDEADTPFFWKKAVLPPFLNRSSHFSSLTSDLKNMEEDPWISSYSSKLDEEARILKEFQDEEEPEEEEEEKSKSGNEIKDENEEDGWEQILRMTTKKLIQSTLHSSPPPVALSPFRPKKLTQYATLTSPEGNIPSSTPLFKQSKTLAWLDSHAYYFSNSMNEASSSLTSPTFTKTMDSLKDEAPSRFFSSFPTSSSQSSFPSTQLTEYDLGHEKEEVMEPLPIRFEFPPPHSNLLPPPIPAPSSSSSPLDVLDTESISNFEASPLSPSFLSPPSFILASMVAPPSRIHSISSSSSLGHTPIPSVSSTPLSFIQSPIPAPVFFPSRPSSHSALLHSLLSSTTSNLSPVVCTDLPNATTSTTSSYTPWTLRKASLPLSISMKEDSFWLLSLSSMSNVTTFLPFWMYGYSPNPPLPYSTSTLFFCVIPSSILTSPLSHSISSLEISDWIAMFPMVHPSSSTDALKDTRTELTHSSTNNNVKNKEKESSIKMVGVLVSKFKVMESDPNLSDSSSSILLANPSVH